MTAQQCRARILQILYEERSRSFPQALDYDDLSRCTGIPIDEVRREVTYLEDKNYLTSWNKQIGARLFSSLRITAKGIDVLEGRATDNTIHVEGDLIQITVGDYAQNVALGKNVTQEIGARTVEATSEANQPSRKGLAKLRQKLTEYFSVEELRTLFFDLGVDYDDLPGESKDSKTRELIAFLVRCDRVSELVELCSRQRPNVSWESPPETTD